MAVDVNSDNIDDYKNFDFRTLGDDEIEVSEQQYRSFPLSFIKQKDGFLLIEVYFEIYFWDYWIRNYSINRFKKAFFDTFKNIEIENITETTAGVAEETDDKILLTWNLRFPAPSDKEEVKTAILSSVETILYNTRNQLQGNSLPTGLKKYFLIGGNAYNIGVGLFWSVALPILGGAFGLGMLLGNSKFDRNL